MEIPQIDVLIWLVLGVIFIGLEFIVPGLIIIFLGFGALIVAALAHFGFIHYITYQIFFWAVISLVLLLVLRNRFAAIFPALEKKEYVREDQENVGTIVEVLKDVSPDNEEGRVRLHGVVWKARSSSVLIPAGEKARILQRDNLLLLVETAKKS